MAFKWKLKEWLAIHFRLYRLADIQRVIVDETGVRWSLETISQLVNKTPKSIRVETMQTLCDAFHCRFSDICEILPDTTRSFTRLSVLNNPALHPVKAEGSPQTKSSDNKVKGNSSKPKVPTDLSLLFPSARREIGVRSSDHEP